MARIGERLPAHLVTRQQAGDHARVALPSAIEQRERAVAMPEETDHRRHAVMGAAQFLRDRLRDGGKRIHHHGDQPIGVQQVFRRAGDMSAVGKDLARDLLLPAASGPFQGGVGLSPRQAPDERKRGSGFEAGHALGRFAGDARQQRDCSRSETKTFERHSMSEFASTSRAMCENVDQPARQHMREQTPARRNGCCA